MQLHDAVRKLLDTNRAERHFAMPRCNERNPFSDEGWYDGDDELVNRVLIEKGSDDVPSAHHPDVLAGLSAKALDEVGDRLGEEVDPGRQRSRRRPPREDIMRAICAEPRTQL